MSDPTPEQRQVTHENVIVFDTTLQTVTVEKAVKYKDHIEDPKRTLKIAPHLSNRVEIICDSRLIASISLKSLGKAANMKRAMGKCNQILVIST